MSKEVKEWKPNPDCNQCKQAVRIFDSHQRIAEHSNTMARKQIRTLFDEKESVFKRNTELMQELALAKELLRRAAYSIGYFALPDSPEHKLFQEIYFFLESDDE